ncbi:hypothetical protein ACS0TY_004842 [Phlomoides rotata]
MYYSVKGRQKPSRTSEIFDAKQERISEAEVSIRRLYGKEKVVKVMSDLDAARQDSSELEAGWFDLFSSRYMKVVYYSTSVFRRAGIASDVVASALVGAANIFGWLVWGAVLWVPALGCHRLWAVWTCLVLFDCCLVLLSEENIEPTHITVYNKLVYL